MRVVSEGLGIYSFSSQRYALGDYVWRGLGSILEAFGTSAGTRLQLCNSADFYVGCFSLSCQSFHHASCFSAATLLSSLSFSDDNHHPPFQRSHALLLCLLCLLARLTSHPVPLARLACCLFLFQLCHACCTAVLHAYLFSSGSSGQLWL